MPPQLQLGSGELPLCSPHLFWCYFALAVLEPLERPARSRGSPGLANTAWAFTKLMVRDSELLDVMRPAAVLKISEFNPQGLANTAWPSWLFSNIICVFG